MHKLIRNQQVSGSSPLAGSKLSLEVSDGYLKKYVSGDPAKPPQNSANRCRFAPKMRPVKSVCQAKRS